MDAQRQILYQLVAPMEKTLGKDEIVRRKSFLQSYADPKTTIDVRSVRKGRASIEGEYDAAIVVPYILEGLIEGHEEGIDASIIGCFSDPGIDAARELLPNPVVGPGMSAIHLALQLGNRFSIISPNDKGTSQSSAYVRKLGVDSRYASTRGMGLSVLKLARDRNTALNRIIDVAKRCLDQDGADVLILGCMSMAFLNISETLEDRLCVPVISPVVAALKTAEMMLAHTTSHSKKVWPAPQDKPLLNRGV